MVGIDQDRELGAGAVRPGLREQNKRSKRLRILAAARELFSQKGFKETTLREVAKRAGVGAGTIFSYARDKRDLLHQVFRQHIGMVEERAFATIPADAALQEQVMHVFRSYFASYAKDPALTRDFMRERYHMLLDDPEGRAAAAAQTLGFLQALAGLVQAAQQRGDLRHDFPPLLAASNLFAAYLLSLDVWLANPAPMDRATVERMLAESVALQIDGLRPRGGRARKERRR